MDKISNIKLKVGRIMNSFKNLRNFLKSTLIILFSLLFIYTMLYLLKIPPIVSIDKRIYVTYDDKLSIRIDDSKDCDKLKYFKWMKELDFYGNRECNIQFLSSMNNLEKLFLYNISFDNLSSLPSCVNLRELTIHNSQLNNLSFLRNVTGVTDLYINNDLLDDLEELSTVEANNYMIDNLEDLKVLKDLKCLTIPIAIKAELAPLYDLKNLIELKLYTNNCELSSLYKCKSLINFSLCNGKIKTLEGIEELCNLNELRISTLVLEDILDLKKLDKLKTLYISNKESYLDVLCLKDMVWLDELHITHSNINNKFEEVENMKDFLESQGVKVVLHDNFYIG